MINHSPGAQASGVAERHPAGASGQRRGYRRRLPAGAAVALAMWRSTRTRIGTMSIRGNLGDSAAHLHRFALERLREDHTIGVGIGPGDHLSAAAPPGVSAPSKSPTLAGGVPGACCQLARMGIMNRLRHAKNRGVAEYAAPDDRRTALGKRQSEDMSELRSRDKLGAAPEHPMTGTDPLPGLRAVWLRVESLLALDDKWHRVEFVLSARSAPSLTLHLGAPLEGGHCSALFSEFALPRTGSASLDALVRQVPRERDTVHIGLDGAVGFLFVPAVATFRMPAMLEALGCDPGSSLFRYLVARQRLLPGFSCGISGAGYLTVCVYDHMGRDRTALCREWEMLNRAMGGQADARPIDRLLQGMATSRPAVTFGAVLRGEEGPAVSLELHDVPIRGVDSALELDAVELATFAKALEVTKARRQRSFNRLGIRQYANRERDVNFQVDFSPAGDRSGVFIARGGNCLDSRSESDAGEQGAVPIILPPEPVGKRAARLFLSSGTGVPSPFEADGPPYRSEAIVPRLPWRLPTASERRRLVTKSSPNCPFESVSVVRCIPQALAGLLRLGLDQATTLHQVEAVRQHAQAPGALLEVADYLADAFSTVGSRFSCLGISAYPPGLRTVSYDHRSGRRVGLHLDTWEAGPPETRASARNILLINLGRSDRYFLFVNRPVGTMGSNLRDPPANADQLADHFMRRFPGHPVVKLRIAPGEAYIAPVQSVLHDGCTEGSQSLDIHVAYLGRFRPPRQAG